MIKVIVEYDGNVPCGDVDGNTWNQAGWWIAVLDDKGSYCIDMGYALFDVKPTDKEIRRFRNESIRDYKKNYKNTIDLLGQFTL